MGCPHGDEPQRCAVCLRAELQQAQEERDRQKQFALEQVDMATRLMFEAAGLRTQRDAAIERHRTDAGRAWETYLIARMVADIVYGRQQRAEAKAEAAEALGNHLLRVVEQADELPDSRFLPDCLLCGGDMKEDVIEGTPPHNHTEDCPAGQWRKLFTPAEAQTEVRR